MKIKASQLYSYLSLPKPEDIKSELMSIHIDTRVMKKENPSIFIAIRGENFDGHDFFSEAIENGAVICIAHTDYLEKGDEVNFIFVEDTLLALQQIAAGIRSESSIPWIGITGSAGKTSTRNFIGQLLKTSGPVLETIKNNNNQIGVPLTVFDLETEHNFSIVEAGTNHFGEIKPLADILRPSIGVITNIGPTHLEFLENIEGVAKEKAELLKSIPANGVAILNEESLMFEYLKSQCDCKVISFGLSSGDYKIEDKILKNDGCVVTINGHQYQLPFKESHYLANFLASLVVALELGIPISDLQESCQGLKPAANRLEVVLKTPIVLIDDSYNASYDSMLAAFEVLQNNTLAKRKIIILGDMKELGEQSTALHERLIVELNKFKFDGVIINGPELINASALIDCAETHAFECKDELISFCLSYIQSNDAVLVKASRSMNFDEVILAIKNKWKGNI